MSTDDKAIDDLLHYDPIRAAETVTGVSYKGDDATLALGMLLGLDHAERKQKALQATGDTYSGMPFAEHLHVFASLGFDVVLDEPFTGTNGANERLVVLWRGDGILATCESYIPFNSTNASNIYYNWLPNHPDDAGEWYGNHDTREGLRHNLAALEAVGTFLNPWRQPNKYMHLLNYTEQHDIAGDWERRTQIYNARIARLPQHVRDAIGGEIA